MNPEDQSKQIYPELNSDELSSADSTAQSTCPALIKFRLEICQKFCEFKKKTGLTHQQIAMLISTDKGRVSNILNVSDKLSPSFYI